jgi:hypothetical protein
MARIQPSPMNPFAAGSTPSPLGPWGARGGNLAELGALIVRLPLRAKTGKRLLAWGSIAVVTLAMLGLNWFDNLHVSLFTLFGGGVVYGNHTAVLNFALVWAALAVFERLKRIQEQKRGVQPHTYSPGMSRLGLSEFLPLRPKVIACAVEPAMAFLGGAVVRRFGFSLLGWIIIAASACFCISEWRYFEREKEHVDDMGDLGLEAQWESDLMKQNGARRAGRGDGATSGLATGIDGLEDAIGQRSRESAGEATGGGL